MATLRPYWPAGPPAPVTVQAARDEISRHFILSETTSHPVFVEQAIELAYLLSAYGLVPDETEPRTAQSWYGGRSRYQITAQRPRHAKHAVTVADEAAPVGVWRTGN
jgi:hypothetical protein